MLDVVDKDIFVGTVLYNSGFDMKNAVSVDILDRVVKKDTEFLGMGLILVDLGDDYYLSTKFEAWSVNKYLELDGYTEYLALYSSIEPIAYKIIDKIEETKSDFYSLKPGFDGGQEIKGFVSTPKDYSHYAYKDIFSGHYNDQD